MLTLRVSLTNTLFICSFLILVLLFVYLLPGSVNEYYEGGLRGSKNMYYEGDLDSQREHFIRGQPNIALSSLVSVGIKTLNRYNKTIAQITSIRKFYPHLFVLVSDDGPVNQAEMYEKLYHVDYMYMEFDYGASASRNELISKSSMKYLVYMDDDMEWTESFDIAVSIQRMKDTSTKMLTIGLDDRIELNGYMGHVFKNSNESFVCLFDDIEKMHYQTLQHPACYYSELGLQLFVAERTFLLNNPWPFEYKTGEHELFFLNIKRRNPHQLIVCTDMIVHHLGFLRTGKEKHGLYDKLRNRAWRLQRKAMGPMHYQHEYGGLCKKQRTMYLQDPTYWRTSNKAILSTLLLHAVVDQDERINSNNQIDKILHVIWIDTTAWKKKCYQQQLPMVLIERVQQFQNSHRQWKLMLWTNELIDEMFPVLQRKLHSVESQPLVMNALQYHILTRYGGVFIDMMHSDIRDIPNDVSIFHILH
jgi:glycosyltransferase involved in cell wall biosynthesis